MVQPAKEHIMSPLTGAAAAAQRMFTRREALGLIGAAGAAAATACGDSPTAPSSTTSTTSTTAATGTGTASTNGACAVTPSETAGPYPSLTDFFRSDIREGKEGTTLTLTVKVVNTNNNCAAVPNAQVEIWHCDVVGNYSQYGSVANRTFLRGIQTTDANGTVTFTTIYPGWYQGRATHVHVEATVNGRSVKVSQMAFPESINNTVHSAGVYASRGNNPTSNASDGIFADSLASELVTPSGSVSTGYVAAFQMAVAL
jgi:protocatechuate 3,4-dioxygenase beta subunit